jgi:hypothetical protein
MGIYLDVRFLVIQGSDKIISKISQTTPKFAPRLVHAELSYTRQFFQQDEKSASEILLKLSVILFIGTDKVDPVLSLMMGAWLSPCITHLQTPTWPWCAITAVCLPTWSIHSGEMFFLSWGMI